MTGFLVFLGIAGFITIVILIARDKQKKTANLKIEFEQALLGTDKRLALAKGREYYASLRSDGKLTIYDEQSLTNDLNTMKS